MVLNKRTLLTSAISAGALAFSIGANAGDRYQQSQTSQQGCQEGMCEPDFCEPPSSTVTRGPGQVVTETDACLNEAITKTYRKKYQIGSQWSDAQIREEKAKCPKKRKVRLDEEWSDDTQSQQQMQAVQKATARVMRSADVDQITLQEIEQSVYVAHDGVVMREITVTTHYTVCTTAKSRKTDPLDACGCDDALDVADDIAGQLREGKGQIGTLAAHSRQDAAHADFNICDAPDAGQTADQSACQTDQASQKSSKKSHKSRK